MGVETTGSVGREPFVLDEVIEEATIELSAGNEFVKIGRGVGVEEQVVEVPFCLVVDGTVGGFGDAL